MAQKETIYNLNEILEELKHSKGLPKELTTEAQLWDEILKKETFLMPEQLFPLIREVYQKSYPKDTPIKPLGTEYSVERSDTREITSVRADVTVLIGSHDIYHFECESKNDKTMVIRMFEYDVHISLSYKENPMSLEFPRSAVLYLQDNRNIPDELSCMIHFPDGGTYSYKVPAVKVQTYSLEEIKDRHLCILIPFLPLRFRKYLRSKKSRQEFDVGELTSFYQEIILILNDETQNGYLSENNRNVILNLLNKSLVRVFYSDERLLKEVVVMTEPILELEIEKYIYALDAKMDELTKLGQELSRKNDECAQVSEELSRKNDECARVSEELEQKDNEYKQVLAQKDEEIMFLKKKLTELQQ